MKEFYVVVANSIGAGLFLFCAQALASLPDTREDAKKFAISAAFLIGAAGLFKFLLHSYPLAEIWTDAKVFNFLAFLFCAVTIGPLYMLGKELKGRYGMPLVLLSVCVVMEWAFTLRPSVYLLAAQTMFLACAGYLTLDASYESKPISTLYIEGITIFFVLFGTAMFLFVQIEGLQTRAIFSKGYEIIRTYQQIIADTEKRLLADTKVLAMELAQPANETGPGRDRLFLWAKMLDAHSVSLLDAHGLVRHSSHPQLVNKDLSYMNGISTCLKGRATASIQRSLLGNVPVLLVSRPLLSRDYEVTGALAIETRLDAIVGDDFQRNGLFLLNDRNQLIFGRDKALRLFSCTVPGSLKKISELEKSRDDFFCIYGNGQTRAKGLCYNGSFFRLIGLPLYGHKASVSKIFSLDQILFNRFELSLALFLGCTIYLILLHKFIKNRFYSLRLQEEVSSRKEAENELKTLASVVEQAVESIVITDKKGVVRYVNPFFENLTGYESGEVVGKKADFLRPSEGNAAAVREIWKAVMDGKAWTGRLESRTKTGRRLVEECIVFPIKGEDSSAEGIVAIKKDVTRERELESLLLHAQKMESVGMLAGGVAHDFNNILAAIQINLDLISLYKYEPAKTKNYLEKIQYGISRASELVRQLLMFSRRQVFDREVVDLNVSIENLLKMLESTLGEDIILEIRTEPELWPIMADPGVVDQIIMNLVVNAKDAMPGGGRLIIATSNETISKEGSEKPFVKLSISDSGSGMSTDVLDRIFDPFFTTKEVGKGTGLGLSVVYGIVKQHGGFIDVRSKEGEGTTFEIFFPAAQEEGIVFTRPQEKTNVVRQGRGEKVLVVEDEESVGSVIKEALSENGYQVTLCSTVEEATEAFVEGGRFDLLLSDVVLPDGSGVDLADIVRGQQPGIAVLLMSGYADKRIKEEEIRKRGYAFFQKPFKISSLLCTIAEVLASKESD